MPTFAPLLDAPFPIQLHVGAAVLAILLLPWTLFRRRKDRVHRVCGYLWVTAMVTTALSSFFINEARMVGPFSAIHLISVYVLIGLWQAVRAAIRRDTQAHQAGMRGIAFGGLGVAGALTLIPGRRMGEMLFGPYSEEGFFVVLAVAVLVAGTVLSKRRAGG